MLNIHSSLVVYLPVIPLVFWRRVAGVEFGFATQSVFLCFFGLMRPEAGFSSDLLIWCLRPPIPKQDQMLCNIEPRPLWGRKKGRGEARQLLTANSLCGIGESQLMCCSTRWCLIRCTAILFKVPLYAKTYQRVLKIAWFSGLSMNSPDGESLSCMLHLSEAVLRCAVLCSLWCHNGHWCFADTSSRVCEKTLGVVCLPTRWFVGKPTFSLQGIRICSEYLIFD